MTEVERENALLKELVRTTPALQADAAQVLATCTTALPAVSTENRRQATDLLNASDFTLMQTLQSAQRSFCITDPSLEDNPIVYASASFLSTTGYPLDEVIGKNCRFLQGPGTFPGTVAELAKGIAEGTDTTVTILNYKKDGTPFWNDLILQHIGDEATSQRGEGLDLAFVREAPSQTGVAYDTREPFRFKKRLSPHYGEFGEGALLASHVSLGGVEGTLPRVASVRV